jgi:hypothetical protein
MHPAWFVALPLVLGCREPAPVHDSDPVPPGRLASSAEVLEFGALRRGEELTQALDLTNEGEGPLTLWDVAFSEDAMRVHWRLEGSTSGVLEPGVSTRLQVTFRPQASGDLGFVLQAVSDDPEARVREVELRGVGLGTPRIVVSPGAVDFGAVALGSAAEARVEVANHGDDDLQIGAVQISLGGEDFFLDVSPAHSVLTPGVETGLAVVRFAPQAAGPLVGTLGIASDDPASPLVEVPLSGEGEPPPSR